MSTHYIKAKCDNNKTHTVKTTDTNGKTTLQLLQIVAAATGIAVNTLKLIEHGKVKV